MCSYLRQMAHVIEHSPYNNGASMSNRHSYQRAEQQGSRHQPTGTFVAQPSTDNPSTGQDIAQASWGSPAVPAAAGAANWGSPVQPDATGSAGTYPVGNSGGSSDNGTDTDTSDDSGNEDLDIDPTIATLPAAQQLEATYWAYRQHKRAWRRQVSKAPRKVRRHMKRTARGKGGTYFGGGSKGRGKGNKGGKRSRNPKDRNGNIMKCSICDSESHLRR